MEIDELRQVSRSLIVSHQILCITGINFNKQTIVGCVELTIHPLVKDFTVMKLNASQMLIFGVTINNVYEAEYSYDDPHSVICSEDDPRRDLNTFLKHEQRIFEYTDADEGNGELTIYIPEALQSQNNETTVFKVKVDFALEKPTFGLHFFVPNDDSVLSTKSRHLFTTGHNARSIFPCVDSYCEPCTWTIEVTIEQSMVVIASGELIECVTNQDWKTYRYYLSTPVPAPLIGLAIGSFESVVDSHSQEITNYCLPAMLPLLTNATSFVHEPIEYYEELLNASCQYPNYKQVFVYEAHSECMSYASMAILSTSLLHPANIIETTWHARTQMAYAVATQFFGCFITMRSWCDWWLLTGLSLYLTNLYTRRAFGNNEYRYNLYQDMLEVIRYEREDNPIKLDFSSLPDADITNINNRLGQMLSSSYLEVAAKKAHLVVRMIDDFIGREIMMQVLNKLMCLATTACLTDASISSRSRLHISTKSFARVVSALTTKDIQPLLTQWVYESGCPKLIGSFTFNRKRNIVELELRQDTTIKGSRRFLGSLMVRVQELEGSFSQTILLEENVTKYDLTCHSKIKRNKKKKIPLISGEEVDIDSSQMDPECPILWIRLDPDMKIIREIQFEQADYHWHCELRYERDILSQFEALEALKRYPSQNTRQTLGVVLDSSTCYYRIRMECACVLAQIANAMANTWTGPPATLSFFRRVFMCANVSNSSLPNATPAGGTITSSSTATTPTTTTTTTTTTIVRVNDFSNSQMYMLQKTIPKALGLQRNKDRVCPSEVIHFLFDLIHYNENSKNRFSDCYYRSSLIDAIGNTITSNVGQLPLNNDHQSNTSNMNLDPNTKRIIDEIVLQLNFDTIIPSYDYCVTSSCLKVLRKLQAHCLIPINMDIFYEYARYGMYDSVRLTACEILVDYVESTLSEDVFKFLLDLIKTDPNCYIRQSIVKYFCKHPPFRQNRSCSLNNPEVVDHLWMLINTCAYHIMLRNDLAEFYQTLFGIHRPNCLPVLVHAPVESDDFGQIVDLVPSLDSERINYYRTTRFINDTKTKTLSENPSK